MIHADHMKTFVFLDAAFSAKAFSLWFPKNPVFGKRASNSIQTQKNWDMFEVGDCHQVLLKFVTFVQE